MRYNPSQFNAEDYIGAAQEHLTEARFLHENGFYVLAHYISGLSVECLLRAYRVRLDKEFEERHDLWNLYKASRFSEEIPERRRHDLSAALAVVGLRWRNNHRFRSTGALRRYLRHYQLDRGIKGDALKESSRLIVEAAYGIVTTGVARWRMHNSR